MGRVLASIPYTTFPTIELGPLNLRTFGLMVALGVLLGAWIAAAYAERFGVSRDETYRVATWMVLAGIIGSRLTWAITHTDQIDSPIDVIAIWEGGIQFSGGFICALIVGLPFFRRWTKLQRWRVLDGYALGLTLGLALGRVGCYSVGEHFGGESSFFLASRWEGGVPPDVREPTLDGVPIVDGTTFHNTALYEFLYLMVLFVVLAAVVALVRRRGREVPPGTLVGVFVLYYGVTRWISDSLRVNDERVLGMTGAQWMCLVMIPAGIWILWKVRPRLAALAAAEPAVEGGSAGVTGRGRRRRRGRRRPATVPTTSTPLRRHRGVEAAVPTTGSTTSTLAPSAGDDADPDVRRRRAAPRLRRTLRSVLPSADRRPAQGRQRAVQRWAMHGRSRARSRRILALAAVVALGLDRCGVRRR